MHLERLMSAAEWPNCCVKMAILRLLQFHYHQSANLYFPVPHQMMYTYLVGPASLSLVALACYLAKWLNLVLKCSVLCRLENATLAVVQSGNPSLLTPDLKGTGTTASFTNAVIKQLEKKSKGRYDWRGNSFTPTSQLLSVINAGHVTETPMSCTCSVRQSVSVNFSMARLCCHLHVLYACWSEYMIKGIRHHFGFQLEFKYVAIRFASDLGFEGLPLTTCWSCS